VEKQNIIRAVAFTAIFLVFVWWGSSGFPTKYQVCEIINNAEHCGSYNILFGLAWQGVLILDRYGALITALATIAIASFTFTLWRATDRLWKAGERQIELIGKNADAALISAKVSERTFKLSHSASLAFRPGRIPLNQIRAAQQISADLHCNNIGRGTAYNVSYKMELHLNEVDKNKFSIDYPETAYRTLVHEEEEIAHASLRNPLTADEAAKIRAGDLAIYGVIVVRYRDDFSEQIKLQAICVAYSWETIRNDKPPKVIPKAVDVIRGDEIVPLTV
jgi:hypothetical protein